MTGNDTHGAPQPGETAPSPQPDAEAKLPAADATLSAAQFRQEFEALKADLSERIKAISVADPPPQTGWRWFFSSGIFFIVLARISHTK